MIRYARAPVDTIDDIDVFISREQLASSDEYRDSNPYRDESTKESEWDHFGFE